LDQISELELFVRLELQKRLKRVLRSQLGIDFQEKGRKRPGVKRPKRVKERNITKDVVVRVVNQEDTKPELASFPNQAQIKESV